MRNKIGVCCNCVPLQRLLLALTGKHKLQLRRAEYACWLHASVMADTLLAAQQEAAHVMHAYWCLFDRLLWF